MARLVSKKFWLVNHKASPSKIDENNMEKRPARNPAINVSVGYLPSIGKKR